MSEPTPVGLETALPASLTQRKIIHVDMDAYYASIEQRDRPELRGKPVVVGGRPDSRGVVCTASYEARKFGIRSAMASAKAGRLCPDAIFVRPRFEVYKSVSDEIRAIFREFTPLIEPLSLDEAYLDVTKSEHGLYAVQIARQIKERIKRDLGLTCSAGVAPNKLVAKVASEARKPDGLTVVTPSQVAAFMAPLPLRKINGIGPVTERRLAAAGVATCRDVLALGAAEAAARLGSLGTWLYDAAQGLDDRPVATSWVRKSYGSEETFATDVLDCGIILAELAQAATSVAEGLRRRSLRARTIVLKLRYHDFRRITRSRTLDAPTNDPEAMFDAVAELLTRTEAGKRPVRLAGLAAQGLVGDAVEDL